MAENCSQKSCYPEDTGCNVEGCINLSDCKFYGEKKAPSKEKNQVLNNEEHRISWTGNTMGLYDLNFITASRKPIFIGVAGVASAGKTTFLATLYCLIRQGAKIGKYSFAGSLTLNGWEDIAWYLSWKDNAEIQFPDHTTNNSGRVPGLLHLCIKDGSNSIRDLIFTDAPGEWFDHWSNNINNENAKGAKWIYENCDSFLLFADCDMLSGNKRGNAKRQIKQVADRLLENITDRPIGLIWSKSDLELSKQTKQQVITHIKATSVKHFLQFKTSVKEGTEGEFHKGILESINWIVNTLNQNYNAPPEISVAKSEDMFLSKRSINP